MHRLDREASGLLVFAKTVEAKEHLQNQFKDHSAGRRYLAAVEGRIAKDDFSVRSYLAENAAYRVYSTRKKGTGKLAITHVHVVKRGPKRSLVRVQLETGRKHQIRVRLAEQGFPIIGDKIYGGRSNPIRRLALHGEYLFEFPPSPHGKADGVRVEYSPPRRGGVDAPSEAKAQTGWSDRRNISAELTIH